MEKLLTLITSVEAAIRYLLTGAVVTAIWLLSLNDPNPVLCWAQSNQVPAALCVAVIGFTAFTVYRLLFWVVIDPIAWKCKASVPSLFSHEGRGYDRPYAQFLRWRHSKDLPESLSGYLLYRWAVAHFVVVTGLAGILAAWLGQSSSFVASWRSYFVVPSLVFIILGIWQCFFLFRVERELCRQRNGSPIEC